MALLNIMVARHSAFYSPLIATIAGGFLEAEGVQATYSLATPERSVPASIGDGSIQVAQLAVSASWGPMERGEVPGFVHFAQINERDGFFIAGREPQARFQWRSMVGKTILVDHLEQPLTMFKFAARRAGVDFGALRVVDAGGVDEMDAAFRSGTGDFIHQQGPAPQQIEKDGVGHVLTAVGEIIGPVAFSSLVATREWLETDLALAFMRAYRRARRYVNQTPAQEIAATQAGFFEGIDADVLAATIAFYQRLGCWSPDPLITRSAYEAALDVFLSAGVIHSRHAYDDVVVPAPSAESEDA